MAQFDVYRFAPRGAGFAFVVDLQSDLLDGLATRIVAPLYPAKDGHRAISRLNPVLQVEAQACYLAVQEMTALRLKSLGPRVGSLRERRAEIIAAVDFLITGV
jgi:toxin CcdB